MDVVCGQWNRSYGILLPLFATMPRGVRSPGTIDWAKSESRQILLDDLEAGVISLDESDTAHELFYGMYQHTPEFIAEEVGFEQFKKRLKSHCKQVKCAKEAPVWQYAALQHDRNIFEKKTHNQRGKKIFYWSDAWPLLIQDVAAKRHITMKPKELKTTRREYDNFSLKIFNWKVRQVVRGERLINWKNDKREADIEEQKARCRALNLSEKTPQEQLKEQLAGLTLQQDE